MVEAGTCSFSGGSIEDCEGGGAGVRGEGSWLTLRGARVTGNKYGGAEAVEGSELALGDCTITNNEGSGILATVGFAVRNEGRGRDQLRSLRCYKCGQSRRDFGASDHVKAGESQAPGPRSPC